MMLEATIRHPNTARETIRAAQNEPVWVMVNHVKADKWEQHKHFIHDLLMPAAEKVDPAAFRHTRVLHPAEQNEDGTYTSVFIMDPVIKSADYNILNLLKRAYGIDKADEYFQLWMDSLASPQTGYELIQSAL